MWKILYKLASPRSFYNISQSYSLPIGLAAAFFLIIGLVWGLGYAPADYQQGEAFRIIYIHVPAAFLSMSLYSLMSFAAILLLVWRIKLAGLMLKPLAKVGATMAFLALATGSIWGKPMWGTWWIWDARLTSELILLLLYIAILVLVNTFQNHEQSDKIAAILILIGLVDLPIIHFSVYWWSTLHQGSTLSLFAKPKIALSMLYPLLSMLLGFILLSIWFVIEHCANEILLRERKQQWVKHVVENL